MNQNYSVNWISLDYKGPNRAFTSKHKAPISWSSAQMQTQTGASPSASEHKGLCMNGDEAHVPQCKTFDSTTKLQWSQMYTIQV